MANENQFKLRTRFLATRGVHEYRATIVSLITDEDAVLELGCAWGTTTALLAERCRLVVGTDVSPQCIARARRSYPHVRFEVLDAFDVRAALQLSERLGVAFTKVYVDLSGLSSYRALLDVIALLTMYATVLRPDTVVAKSGSLKHFASHCWAWGTPSPSILLEGASSRHPVAVGDEQ
jgi:trans-aconitate methyltransferase